MGMVLLLTVAIFMLIVEIPTAKAVPQVSCPASLTSSYCVGDHDFWAIVYTCSCGQGGTIMANSCFVPSHGVCDVECGCVGPPEPQ